MLKKHFVVSSLSKPSDINRKTAVLDNFIALNNPELQVDKLHNCPRNSLTDWVEYEQNIITRHKRYVKILSERLNQIHNISNSDKYWKQTFYRGLKRYISLVYEFYNQVEERFDHDNHDFYLLDNSDFYTPMDLEDLRTYLSYSDIANEQLFAIYVNFYYPSSVDDKKKLIDLKKYRSSINEPHPSLVKQIIYYVYSKMSILKPNVILLGVGYASSRIHSLIFKSKFKIFLHNMQPLDLINSNLATEKRQLLSSWQNDFDKFDKFFFKTTESFFPNIFIENYLQAATYYEKQAKQYSSAKYVISELWISNNAMSFLIAHLQKENNVKFINSEHRGMTHIFENSEFKETLDLCDEYLTIGWYDKQLDQNFKLTPAGLLNDTTNNPKDLKEYKDKILYMTAPIYAKRTNYFHDNFFMGEDSKYTFEFQKSFFSSLDKNIFSRMIYRMAPIMKVKDIATYNQKAILKPYTDLMHDDTGVYSGLDAMSSSKLVIIDYIGSGYLEALMNNIPTLVFLNQNAYFSKSGAEFFSELIEANILHADPIKAALFLMEIEHDPLDWWMSENTQKARKSFINKAIGDKCILENIILKLTR